MRIVKDSFYKNKPHKLDKKIKSFLAFFKAAVKKHFKNFFDFLRAFMKFDVFFIRTLNFTGGHDVLIFNPFSTSKVLIDVLIKSSRRKKT